MSDETPRSCRDVWVMVVEDHDDSRELLVFSLEALGAHVVSASGAATALEYMRAVRPDVIVSDLSMPGQDGFQFLHAVRSSTHLKDVPAIAVTGHGDLRGRAEESGFQRFLQKPIDPEELCRMIATLAGRGRPSQ